jgi:hypothetical protein
MLQVHLIFPIVYIIATVFITIVPMIASPVETGLPFSRFLYYRYKSSAVLVFRPNSWT